MFIPLGDAERCPQLSLALRVQKDPSASPARFFIGQKLTNSL